MDPAVVRHQDVFRLYASMDIAGSLREEEGAAHLLGNTRDRFRREIYSHAMRRDEPVAQTLAFDQIGDDEMQRAVGAEIVYRHDVWMLKAGDAKRVLLEPLNERLIGQAGIEEFNGDRVFR